MAASFQCSERLPDFHKDNSPSCSLAFTKTGSTSPRTALLSEYKVGASYLPNPSYALSVQNCSAFFRFRERTYSWMLGVCHDKRSCSHVAYAGMNYFDRYLSVKVIEKEKIELLSWLCLHIASSTFDKYSNHLSFREILGVVEDTYTLQEIQNMELDILSVLECRLNPYSPYFEGGSILELAGHSSIYPNYQSLLNGICMKYESLTVNPKSITNTCILLAWLFSYPSSPVPAELCVCTEVYRSDFEKIMKWVKELFPMMGTTCDEAVKYCDLKREGKGVSPTNVLQNV